MTAPSKMILEIWTITKAGAQASWPAHLVVDTKAPVLKPETNE